MLAKVYSAAVYGVDAYEVEIEVNASAGNPVIVVVGQDNPWRYFGNVHNLLLPR